MKCDCCGRNRRFLESFTVMRYGQVCMNFCADCNDLAYRIRDDANERNREKYDQHLNEWNTKAEKSTPVFRAWQREFLATLEAAFK